MEQETSPLAIVTGSNGWLGSRLVRALAAGLPELPELFRPSRAVRCLVLPGSDTSPLRELGERVQVVEGDLTLPPTLSSLFTGARGATVFHCAGLIHPHLFTRRLFQVNIAGTRNLLAAAAAAGVHRIVHVSSNSPLGVGRTPDEIFDETAPFRPYMKYGRTKMAAEQLVQAEVARGTIEGIIIRPPWFYGPGQPPRQTRFFSMIRAGRIPIVGSGENRRSMAYVDNICQGLLLAEASPRADGQVYWIADRRPYTMNEIVDTIERLLEQEFDLPVAHRRMRLPALASRTAWGIDLVLQTLGLYNQEIHVLSEMNRTIACSIALAERELGYAPRIDLEEGMRRSIASVLESGGTIP